MLAKTSPDPLKKYILFFLAVFGYIGFYMHMPNRKPQIVTPLLNLVPGQIVAIANCREYGIIKERIAKNLYLVDHEIGKGKPFPVSRKQILTYVRGAFRPNANASSLAPHMPIGNTRKA